MKKTTLIVCALASVLLPAYSQGVINVANTGLNGSVVTNNAGNTGLATAFSVGLYYLPTQTQTVPTTDAYGYLSYANFLTDGFTLAKQGTQSSAGNFAAGTATLTGITGGYSSGYTANEVVALAAWTGAYGSLAAAEASGTSLIGIIAFLNNVGPGGSDPHVPLLTGWNSLTASPIAVAFEGSSGFPDLVLKANAVPEPGTLALAALGGASILLFRRRK